jgi:hypothetical protein
MRKDKSWLGPISNSARRANKTAVQRARSLSSAAAPIAGPNVQTMPFPEHEAPERKRLLETSSELRKQYPITTGVLDYFPDAIAAVAEVSFVGNQKHNPGEPLHWARGKSMDHADCAARHLIERGGFDGRCRHSACLAWRALANLQEELEAEYGLAAPRGATELPPR